MCNSHLVLFVEMAHEFELLLDRNDLPAIIMEYDTTFDTGNFYVSWLSFRHTEFIYLPDNPMPTMGWACLIHTKKIQSCHEYFFNVIKEEIPTLQDAKNVLMCTGEETAIVNAFKKVFPDIPHARCHIHAWRDIKKKLKSIGITAKPDTAKYREQFYELLHQENYEQYCASLEILQRHVWKKVCRQLRQNEI
ncbi:Uncharacterized protein APZ42_010509 [Daphnia magna]|uniref:MULE transposase domain-containing protein n=1 Tax=Daphnia magna TaxID=35525 RepID=A0A164DD30_9CRUS|nr:Uncharacterized protein APZ42_010509 [Daphnia magna]